MILLICLIGIIPAESQRLHVYYFLYINEFGMEHFQLQVQLTVNRFLRRKWLYLPKPKQKFHPTDLKISLLIELKTQLAWSTSVQEQCLH